MEKKINEIHEMIKELFPEAVAVHVFVNSEGIDVKPTYKTDLTTYSMRRIDGKWVTKGV